jgi:hypothetical protein
MTDDRILEKILVEVFWPLYQLALGLAFCYFLYGAFMFIVNMNDPEKKLKGQRHLLWGLIGLFIIFSAGAIVRLFNDMLGGMFVF